MYWKGLTDYVFSITKHVERNKNIEMKVNIESLCKLQNNILLQEVQVCGATCFMNNLHNIYLCWSQGHWKHHYALENFIFPQFEEKFDIF